MTNKFKSLMTGVVALSFSVQAHTKEIVEVPIFSAVSVCDLQDCEAIEIPDNPEELIRKIELSPMEGAPGMSFGFYTEEVEEFAFILTIVKVALDGQQLYTVSASVDRIDSLDDRPVHNIEFSSTSIVLDRMKDLHFVVHSSLSAQFDESRFKQPLLMFGGSEENFGANYRSSELLKQSATLIRH